MSKMDEIRKKQWIETYDREAGVYDSTRSFYEIGYGGYREKKLLSLFCRGQRVLNLACGSGRVLSFLVGEKFEVIGLDFSRGMLAVAREKLNGYGNLHLIRGDAEFPPFQSCVFDEIVCSRAFKFFPNPLRALAEVSRILRNGGRAVFTMETSDPLWIRLGYRLNNPYMGSRFEWRYRIKKIRLLFEKASFIIHFTGCVIYFGKTIYQITGRYFRPMLRLLELIDSHSKIGRNIIIVGTKPKLEQTGDANHASISKKQPFV